MCVCVCVCVCVSVRVCAKLRENPIRFQIMIQLESNFPPCVSSNLSF